MELRNVIRISADALIERLIAIKHATPLSMTTVTVPEMRVGGNPYRDDCLKVTEVNGIYYWDYEASVNRVLVKHGEDATFVAKQRAWGTFIEGTGLIQHKGKVYVQLKVQNVMDVGYKHRDGRLFSVDETRELVGFMRPARESLVVLRDYNVENIQEVRVNREIWVVGE